MRRLSYVHACVFCAVASGLLAGVSVLPLQAQQRTDLSVPVDIRASVQDGFVRFVFSGAVMPAARVAQEVGKPTLSVTFNSAVKMTPPDVSGISPAANVVINGNVATITVDSLQRQRHMRLGERLLVDVFTRDAPKVVKGAAKPADAPVNAPEQTVATTQDMVSAREVDGVKAPASAPQASQNASPVVSADAVKKADLPKPELYHGEAVITFGSNSGLMMAAFERGDDLWVVVNGEQTNTPPQITGKNQTDIALKDVIEVQGGRMYRFSMPKGAFVTPEGGGLVWRLHISGHKPERVSVVGSVDLSDMAAGARYKLQMPGAGVVLRVPDPMGGEDLAALLVSRSGGVVGVADRFVDFNFIPAIVGAFVRPKVDGFSVTVLPNEVMLGRQGGGLRFSATGMSRQDYSAEPAAEGGGTAVPSVIRENTGRMYDFAQWGMGGANAFFPMRRALDTRIAAADEADKLPEIMNAAKFMLAQGLPQEALGYMQMAQGLLPLLSESADYQALSGAIYVLLRHYPAAIEVFKNPAFVGKDDIALWRAVAYQGDGDADAAQESLPRGTVEAILADYPPRLQAALIPLLLDTIIARGDVRLAENLVNMYDANIPYAVDSDRGLMLAYYRGQIALLRGDQTAANELLEQAAQGVRGPYPVRAALLKIARGREAKNIDLSTAEQQLERFRYGWRGDTYERQVLENLGQLYIDEGDYLRGLGIMRGAASLAASQADQDAMVAVMRGAFRDLFTKPGGVANLKPVEAAAVAAEFSELMPAGEAGEDITLGIAQRMMDIDLLGRAADLIEPLALQVSDPDKALKYAERTAGIRLLDRKPKAALSVLQKTMARPEVAAVVAQDKAKALPLTLLAAQAKADMGHVNEAIADLNQLESSVDSLKLLVDITWKAQRWAQAADALGRLIAHSNLNATRVPTAEEAQMVFNRALALNLAGDTNGLENLGVGYRDIMRRTQLYRPFLLVTRSARDAQLADRATLMSMVSEVGLFQEVLDTYKNNGLVPLSNASGQAD